MNTFDFQDWVTREVLPAIRRTGGYLLNEHAPRLLSGLRRVPWRLSGTLRRQQAPATPMGL